MHSTSLCSPHDHANRPSLLRRCAFISALVCAALASGCAETDDGTDPNWPSGEADGGVAGTTGGTTAGTISGPGGTTAGTGFPGGTTGTLGGTTGTLGGTTAGSTGGILGGILGGLIGGTTGGTSGGPSTPLDPSMRKPDPSKLPTVNGACPDLSRNGRIQVAGSTVQVWVGTKPGPVYFYFHGTGSAPSEVDSGLPGATSGVRTNGGIVASWEVSNGRGDSTGSFWAVWYTGDFEAADQILACGIEKGIVDTGRIHVAGYSAGGLQAGTMLYQRSNYIASGIVYSGGGGVLIPVTFKDPSHVPAMLGAHGAQGSDWLILDFSDETIALGQKIKSAGGFAMDCDDGEDHISFVVLGSRAGVGGKGMQFLQDHPYNTKPSPYASGIPTGFPSHCKVL